MGNDFSRDFGPFDNHIWLNCAHQGALPRVAVKAAQEAIAWKIAPYNLTTERFSGVPARLRKALGKLISTPAEDIILGNSASYGLHLLANGIRWEAGDEILLLKGDFPADILPWLQLRNKGVVVRLIEPREFVVQVDELATNISARTRLVCMTWVHSFSGYAVDGQAIGELCRSHNVKLVLNVSQALGTRPLDVSTFPVDAITSVGFKWLCGPYGTGFCWIRPELRETLEYNQAYWLAMQTADDLANDQVFEAEVKLGLGARAYDVFGTANFFNFKPLTASIEYLLEQGIEQIVEHNYSLVSKLIEGIDQAKYRLLSPRQGLARSTLIFVSHKDPSRNGEIYEGLRARGVYPALRGGKLRFSPHLYNTDSDIETAVAILNSLAQ